MASPAFSCFFSFLECLWKKNAGKEMAIVNFISFYLLYAINYQSKRRKTEIDNWRTDYLLMVKSILNLWA